MTCRRCGEPIIPNSKKCPKCGLENPGIFWEKATGAPVSANKQQIPHATPQSTPQTTSKPAPQTEQPTSSTAVATKKKSSPLKTILTIAVLVVIGILIYNFITNHGLKGTWVSEDNSSMSITFSDRKTGYVSYGREHINFTYTVEGKKVTIKTEETLFNNSEVGTLKFKATLNKLTLTDENGIEMAFRKK